MSPCILDATPIMFLFLQLKAFLKVPHADIWQGHWGVWIGLSDGVNEGDWVWKSGGQVSPEVAAKANWNQSGGVEPNGHTKSSEEDCALMVRSGAFLDNPCSNKKRFVCQLNHDSSGKQTK